MLSIDFFKRINLFFANYNYISINSTLTINLFIVIKIK